MARSKSCLLRMVGHRRPRSRPVRSRSGQRPQRGPKAAAQRGSPRAPEPWSIHLHHNRVHTAGFFCWWGFEPPTVTGSREHVKARLYGSGRMACGGCPTVDGRWAPLVRWRCVQGVRLDSVGSAFEAVEKTRSQQRPLRRRAREARPADGGLATPRRVIATILQDAVWSFVPVRNAVGQ